MLLIGVQKVLPHPVQLQIRNVLAKLMLALDHSTRGLLRTVAVRDPGIPVAFGLAEVQDACFSTLARDVSLPETHRVRLHVPEKTGTG